MSKTPEELLAIRIGNSTVGDNLKRAVESGALTEDIDGRLAVTPQLGEYNWAVVQHGPPLQCGFLMYFLFFQAYAQKAVPHGCSACYKVKVAPRTLRELVAAWGIAKGIACHSKWGVDFTNQNSQHLYAGYFYCTGLDGARVLYKVVREAIDAHPLLGPGVGMTIKRGCSNYEAALGPSDKFEFADELIELEAWLKTRFKLNMRTGPLPVPLAHWLDFAYCIGDNTYLDFTGGRPLRPPTVSYSPEPDNAGEPMPSLQQHDLVPRHD